METLSIESAKEFSIPLLQKTVARNWNVESSSDEGFVVHGTGTRAYIYLDTESCAVGLGRLLIDYSDVSLAKALLEKIADDASLIVNNDFGTILPGDKFVARCKANEMWDWRQ